MKFEPFGERLLQTLVELTGLPDDLIRVELEKIIEGAGHSHERVTMDQLRLAMAEYLNRVDLDMTSRGQQRNLQ